MPIKPKGSKPTGKTAKSSNQPIHICPACRKPLAKLDRRKREGEQLVPLPGVTLIYRKELNQAPYLRCACGHVLILLSGSV
jgi:hypothetical protein